MITHGTAAHAEEIARLAFQGMRNPKDGEPMIRHTERVVANLLARGYRGDVISVAWLHDVVEDTDITLDELRESFSTLVIWGVDAITHREDMALEDYWARVGNNLLALRVKLLGDLPDNTDPDRRARLDIATRDRLGRKYLAAYLALIPWTTTHPAW